MWRDNKNDDGTLFNSKANMWVMVVTTEDDRNQLAAIK
jgi:hypothetical protein